MTDTTLAIQASGLVKRYDGDVLAVDGVDLAIAQNTIYALLGPNGAGKTTTISVLTTLIEPTAGSARVCGLDVVAQAAEVRRCIGVTFQETVLDDDLTGRQVMDYHGRLYGQTRQERQRRIAELIALVELEDAADRPVNTYSGGMKRRLELARGLMTSPSVLFLDEPTLGLDPQNRSKIWEYIRALKEQNGLTLLLTTHYMEEAEMMADRVGIIDRGKIMVEGTPHDLITQMGADSIRVDGCGDCGGFGDKLRALDFVESVHVGEDMVQIGVDDGNKRLAQIVTIANDSGVEIEDISVAKPSLGDVFLRYTGRELRDK
jgi:ABC-2 type transport system ATP-binding protein